MLRACANGPCSAIAPDGSGERQVTDPPADFSDDFPDFAADSSVIAFQRCGSVCRVFTVRPDGSGLRAVTPGCTGNQESPRCSEDGYAAISPNVKRIAFTHAFGRVVDDQIDHAGIYTVRTDGSHMRRVTLPAKRTAEDGEPQWSPDGNRLVFVRYNITAKPAGKQAIFVVNADGSGLHRITPWKLTAGDGPDWSPDGSRILFRAPENDDFLNSNLYTIQPDGHGLQQLTNVPAETRLYSASFPPDGTAITFGMQGIDDAADVYRMNADGTDATPITRTPQWDSAPDWGGLR